MNTQTFAMLTNYLQELGYRTAVVGKWHMGIADRYHPLKRGFDEFCGFRGGARSFFAYSNPKATKHENLIERGFENYREHEGYLTNGLAAETCQFIERNQDKPFFAYVSFNAVHTPMEADPQDKDEFPELEGTRRTAAQMMLSLDRACGQIVDKLKMLRLDDNTLIVFTNDNGGPMDKNGSSNYPFAGVKATQLEGGIRVPGIVVWPGKLPAGAVYDKPLSTLDLLPTFVKAGGGDPRIDPRTGRSRCGSLSAGRQRGPSASHAVLEDGMPRRHPRWRLEVAAFSRPARGTVRLGRRSRRTEQLGRHPSGAGDSAVSKTVRLGTRTRAPVVPAQACGRRLVGAASG